ncbi:MAG: ATP-binding protein [Chloroflexi bacterium]|nr:ATP-binding protein [Chloroflexota bacterium]
MFQRATKHQSKLRLALLGIAGSGKTYTALSIANHLGKAIAVIDTEHGSASKYADDVANFDVAELTSFHPQRYIDAIHAAEQAGYDVLIIDSLSHAWNGKDGVLEQVDRIGKRSGNKFTAWADATPLQQKLIETILASRMHIICTMRLKTEYVVEQNDRGKQAPRKIGLAPIQRDGLEYEFDVVADIDADNTFIVTKTRCPALHGAIIPRAGAEVATTLLAWLDQGQATPQTPLLDQPIPEPEPEIEPEPEPEPELFAEPPVATPTKRERVAKCRGCAAEIVWVGTMPYNTNGHGQRIEQTHWETCPKAHLFRRTKRPTAAQRAERDAVFDN